MLLIASSARRSYHSTGPKSDVSVSLNGNKLSSRKKVSSGSTLTDALGCKVGNGNHDCEVFSTSVPPLVDAGVRSSRPAILAEEA
jgi:hypothetical protein